MSEGESTGAATASGLRRGLLAVHRELLDAQVIESEKATGHSLRPSDVLKAAMEDPRFAWLRELSGLVADLDAEVSEARSEERAPDLADSLERARSLVAPPDPNSTFGRLYLRALQENPAVVMAHRDLIGLLGRDVSPPGSRSGPQARQ